MDEGQEELKKKRRGKFNVKQAEIKHYKIFCHCAQNKAHSLYEHGITRKTLKKHGVSMRDSMYLDENKYQLTTKQMEMLSVKCKQCEQIK